MFWTKHCFATIERHICRIVCFEQPLPGQTRNPMLCPPRWMGPGCAPSGMPTQAHCHHPRANTKPYALPHLDGWAQGVSPWGCPPRPLPPLPGQTRNPMLCPTSMDGPRVCPFGDAHPGPPPSEHKTLCSAHLDGWAKGVPPWGCPPRPTATTPHANTKP